MGDSGNGNWAIAAWYDLDPRPVVKDDIFFYLERARRAGGDILELACGTGRVGIPLARAGFRVTGVDLSPHMLARFREKLQRESEDTRSRVELREADMTDVRLGRTFALVILPFRSFQLLTEEEQASRCLRNVRRHLRADGTFIVNVFNPFGRLDESWVQLEAEDWIMKDDATGCEVRRTHIRRSIDVARQIIYPEHRYYVKYPDGHTEVFADRLAMKVYEQEPFRRLLIDHGFQIAEEYGYYDGRPAGEGGELIFVCKAASSREPCRAPEPSEQAGGWEP